MGFVEALKRVDWRPWLRLGRVSNLPTVWSNVLVGYAIALMGVWRMGFFSGVLVALLLMLAMSLLYVGGMVLNDVCDARRDALERKERPIPRGEVEGWTALGVACGLFFAGWLVMVLVGSLASVVATVLLITAIAVYDVGHHRWAWTWPVMGVCRGLVVLTAALVFGVPGTLAAVVALVVAPVFLAVYTIGLTALSRMEHGVKAERVRGYVRWAIVCMPVVDAVLLVFIEPGFVPLSLLCVPATWWGQRWVSGV